VFERFVISCIDESSEAISQPALRVGNKKHRVITFQSLEMLRTTIIVYLRRTNSKFRISTGGKRERAAAKCRYF
jgi:hypothetical protein